MDVIINGIVPNIAFEKKMRCEILDNFLCEKYYRSMTTNKTDRWKSLI